MPQQIRRPYLISVTTHEPSERTAMRNALWRLQAKEVLPGLFWVGLTDEEKQRLARRFVGMRARAR